MSYSRLLDQLISDIGGCGKFQFILTFLLHISKTIVTWSMLHMTFNGQEPGFVCVDNLSGSSWTDEAFTNGTLGRCTTSNDSDCTIFQYDGSVRTVVTEWDLVCDRKWIVATITTIQMAGVLVGCFVAGHLGDWIGRKPTYFLSILILIIFNIVGYFSVSWEMYAFVRFMLGLAVGFFVAVYRNLIIEYVTSVWRPRTFGIPSWSVEAGLLALVTWLCKSWKIVHIASAVVGLPVLLTWWLIPESFRWLITKGRYDEAELAIERVAKLNGYEKPDISHIFEQAKLEEKEQPKHYTAVDLFKTKEMIVKTLVFIFLWGACSYAYYGLTFGLKNFAGDFYLNMFVTYLVEIPTEIFAMYLSNRFGRKKTCIAAFFFTAVCGIINGILENVDVSAKVVLLNVFALSCKMGLLTGWLPMAVLTVESYPTVIRTTSYGVVNTAARVGGMIAPQIVFLNDSITGMLYFLSGAVTAVSACLCFLFTETKDQVLEDTMKRQSFQDLSGYDKQTNTCQTRLDIKSPNIQTSKF